jgi:hypothetical protein
MKTRSETAQTRCITPTMDDISDDEIPHLMKPYSSDVEDEHYSEPELASNNIDASPLSSISSYTRGDTVDASGLTKMLPRVSISPSEDGSTSANSRTSSRTGSSRRRVKLSASPPTILKGHHSSPILQLVPRMGRKQMGSISPLTTRCFTPVQDVGKTWSSSPISTLSNEHSTRTHRNGQESPISFSSRPPPSPRLVNSHRRSTSLNLPYSTSRRKYDELKLSTLKEGSQSGVENEVMPISYSTRLAHRNAVLGLKHRRTVSFPDEVLQGSNTDRRHQLYPYDITLDCDDPALFSLVGTTQARSDGRVYISSDVDPFLGSPVVSMHSIRQDSKGSAAPNDLRSHRKKKDHANRRHRRTPSAAGSKLGQEKQAHQVSDELIRTNGQSNARGLQVSEITSSAPTTNTQLAHHHKYGDKKIASQKRKEKYSCHQCIIQ